MKKYYNLIGNDIPLEPWVITYDDLMPQLPQITELRNLISSNRWPILFFHQIPKRFLEQPTHFPVLLREEVNFNLPDWVHQPVTSQKTILPNRYFIQTKNLTPIKNVLFICSGNNDLNWMNLQKEYPGRSHYWFKQDNKVTPPNDTFPDQQFLNLLDIVHFDKVPIDLVVDLSFGQVDTYSPLHQFCLQSGANLAIAGLNPPHNLSIKEEISISCNASIYLLS